MIVSSGAVIKLCRARYNIRMAYKGYENRNDPSNYYWRSRCAYDISMSVEYILKAQLEFEGIEAPEMHDHLTLSFLCGHYSIKLPKRFRDIMIDIKSFEGVSRYKEDLEYELDEEAFLEIYNIVNDYINKVWEEYYWSITSELQNIVEGFNRNTATEADIKWQARKLPTINLKPAVDINILRGKRR